MKIKIILFALIAFCCYGLTASAQNMTQTESNEKKISDQSGDTKFLLTGYGFAGFEKEGDEGSTFGPLGFDPIFLWKKTDKLFFEAEMEFALEDGELEVGLEYGTIHYRLAKNLTFGAGKFLVPFGTFGERLHPSWINKFAEMPLGLSHEGGARIGPMSDLGFEFRGGAQLGTSKINYVAYVTNGPKLNSGSDDPMMAGMLHYENLNDNNKNKAIGGRIGFLPFSSSAVEVGISGQVAKVGDNETQYEDVQAALLALDLSVVQKISPISSNIDIKAQYNHAKVDNAMYSKSPTENYTFDNKSSSWYAQAALRPAFVENNFLKNLEVGVRLAGIETPEGSMWESDISQTTIGLNYWFDWNSVLKFNYQRTNDKLGDEKENSYFIQWALGF